MDIHKPHPNPADRRPSLFVAVGANWLGYVVFAISGFILPRLIGDHLGQELLGIWDFAWSSVNFTQWLAFGISSAASRDVARFRAVGDWSSLNRTVSAALLMLVSACLAGVFLIASFVFLTPFLLPPETDAAIIGEALYVVAILGISAAASLPLGLFSGFLSGLERWGLKNLTRSVTHLVALGVMVALLLAGYGLVALAWTTLAAEVAASAWDYLLCRRHCPQMRLSPRLVTRASLGEVLSFGGRTYLQGVARGALYQINGLIVAYFLGPAALAVYARQRNLVAFAQRLLNQYGNVFTPASAALDAAGNREELRRLAVQAARYGLFLTLPMIVVLGLAGGPLVRIWMGAEYEAPLVLAVFAFGHVASLANRGLYRILVGINRHGAAGAAELWCAALAGILSYVVVGVLQWGLLGASLAVALSVTVGGGAMPVYYICRALDLRLSRFLYEAALRPLVSVLPLVASLLLARQIFPHDGRLELLAGVGTGGLLLCVIYWHWALPESLKNSLLRRLNPSRRTLLRSVAATVPETGR